MTTFAVHAVSNLAGELLVACVRLNHPSWAAPLLFVFDNVAWTVIDENGDSVTFEPIPGEIDAAGTDETAIDSRTVKIADLDLLIWRRLEKLSRAGNTVPVEVTIYEYLSSDLSAPAKAPAILEMSSPDRDNNRIVTFQASSMNTINRDAPTRYYTWANAPGLRR